MSHFGNLHWLVIRIVFRCSMWLLSALHCAIFPNLSDSVILVVAANVGIDSSADSLLVESSDSEDDTFFRRFSPSIFTLARSYSKQGIKFKILNLLPFPVLLTFSCPLTLFLCATDSASSAVLDVPATAVFACCLASRGSSGGT